jgi:hypothetical protein
MNNEKSLPSLSYTFEELKKLSSDPTDSITQIIINGLHKLYPKIEAELQRMIDTGVVKTQEELARDYVLVEWREQENMTIRFCAQIMKREEAEHFTPPRNISKHFQSDLVRNWWSLKE